MKSVFVVPLFALILVSFSTKQTLSSTPSFTIINTLNIIELVIDKSTTDDQLIKFKTDLAKENFDISYTTVRNKNGEIKNISIEVSGGNKKNGEVSSRYKSTSDNDTIDPIYIIIDTTKNSILIRNSSISSNITDIKQLKSDNNKQVSIQTSSTNDYDIKISEEESNSFMFVSNDSNKSPLYYIDGIKSDAATVKNLNESSIESMNVLKGVSAIKKYGEEAAHGVVEIQTKK
ncbi:TonB-dependent receptor plug domain-containing protein [Maribacter hydrothermalis]|nr:TonB-dependent receptor plug domain-containing protein [Maribacter hydrothermalis]